MRLGNYYTDEVLEYIMLGCHSKGEDKLNGATLLECSLRRLQLRSHV